MPPTQHPQKTWRHPYFLHLQHAQILTIKFIRAAVFAEFFMGGWHMQLAHSCVAALDIVRAQKKGNF
jgi:hypothetical protein